MNPLRQIGRCMLFVVRNGGRKPKYPFVDDGVDSPLELHIGPWGRTQWRDTEDGTLYEINTVDDVESIVDSVKRDVYCSEYQDIEAMREAEELRPIRVGGTPVADTKSPCAIGFWLDSPSVF